MGMYISPPDTRLSETGVTENMGDMEKRAEQPEKVRVRIRFDYRGTPRPARFFFGGRGTKDVAEERRDKQAAMWKNVPLQGIQVEDISYLDLYTVYESADEAEIAYAPLELLISLDSLEDCFQFISRNEFRRLRVVEPDQINFTGRELERILFKFSETIQHRLQEQEEG